MDTNSHPKPNYVAVFWSLFVLTIVEIFVANLDGAKWMIIVALIFFAIVKALLVAFFYMHLKFEKVLLAVIIFAPLIFSAILTLMVGADIGR